jgi:hypothetical protein
MRTCININHPDIIKLSKDLKIPKTVVAAKVAIWQKKNNNYEKFPTLEHFDIKVDNNNQNQYQYQDKTLFGLDIQNQENLEFHVNTINVVTEFLYKAGVSVDLVPEFLSQDGSIVEGAIAAANFIKGTVDIVDDLKNRPAAWNKLPEEAAHWWYRLLDNNSELKKALWNSHLTASKNDELYRGNYGNLVSKPEDLTEESIGQLIAEAIKRIETKNGNAADYSFFESFLNWIKSLIDFFKDSQNDTYPFEIAAMKILSSDMSDLMSWEEYNKIHNQVYFDSQLTNQSIKPVDYSLIYDLVTTDNYGNLRAKHSDPVIGYVDHHFDSNEDMDFWVFTNYGDILIERQKNRLQEVKDNQIFFDRLLNKTFKKKSRYLTKTLDKYYTILDANSLTKLQPWNVENELLKATKKLSNEEKDTIIQTNGYFNITPTLKTLPAILQKYGKSPIVLSEEIKVDGAKKQELNIINNIRKMIVIENPNKRTIKAEEFVNEVHNWLEVNYLLGFANETQYLSYNVDQTFTNVKDRISDEPNPLGDMTEEEIQRLPLWERQRIAAIIGLTKQNPDVYHNKVSLRFNDTYHLKSGHFSKSPSAWGNLTYFYTGRTKWKDAVLLHEIQNDNIEYLRSYKPDDANLEESLQRYLKTLNSQLLDNIEQIKYGGRRVHKEKIDMFAHQAKTKFGRLLLRYIDRPLEQGYSQLKERLRELINIYNAVKENHLDFAQTKLDEAYSKRRVLQNFIKNGGLKSLLDKYALADIKEIIHDLNTETTLEGEDSDLYGFYDENDAPATTPRIRNLREKKRAFKFNTSVIQNIINDKLKELYGDNVPNVTLEAPAKPLSKRQRDEIRRLRNQAGMLDERPANSSHELNENIEWFILWNEKRMLKESNEYIDKVKKEWITARNETVTYNFNSMLLKMSLEQYTNLVENYQYNVDLLSKSVDERIEEKLKTFDDNDTKALSIINYLYADNVAEQKKIGSYTFLWDTANTDKGLVAVWDHSKEDAYVDNWTSKEFLEYVKNNSPELLDINNIKIELEKRIAEKLSERALEKKEKIEVGYDELNQEIINTLEIEMNYFTPLIHHLIQKHISTYGKDFPMYFSGYNITKLTQGSNRTSLMYAGKEEIDIINHSTFSYNDNEYIHDGNMKYVPLVFTIINKEHGEIQYRKINDEYSIRDNGFIRNISKQEYEKAKQEYEKAYQQATEQRAKEIKFNAARQIGLLTDVIFADTLGLSDEDMNEGIKRLNDYKKQSKENLDRVINTIMNINQNKPIETGYMFNAMSQVSGIKLIWQDKIEGIKGNAGGYLVDLSNYNFNTPILYGLQNNNDIKFNIVKRSDLTPLANKTQKEILEYDFFYRVSKDIENKNELPSELEQYNELISSEGFQDTLKSVLHLGNPSELLKDAGMTDLPITVARKYFQEHIINGVSHNFTADDINSIMRAIHSPLAIYRNREKEQDGTFTNKYEILTYLSNDKGEKIVIIIQENIPIEVDYDVVMDKPITKNFNVIKTAFNISNLNRLSAAIRNGDLIFINRKDFENSYDNNNNRERAQKDAKMYKILNEQLQSILNATANFKNPSDVLKIRFNNQQLETLNGDLNGELIQTLIDKLQSTFSQFKNISIVYNINEFAERARKYGINESSIQQLTDSKGNVYGAVLPDGIIYLDKNNFNVSTLIHEHSHLWNQVVKKTKPKLWEQIKKAIKETQYWNDVVNNEDYDYLNGDEDAIADEAFARLVGDYGNDNWQGILELSNNDKSLFNQILKLLQEYFNFIAETLGFESNLKAEDFAKLSLFEMISGQPLKINSPNIDKQFNELSSDIKETFKSELLDVHTIVNSGFERSSDINTLINMVQIKRGHRNREGYMLAPNGEPTKLSENDWLYIRTDEFMSRHGNWFNQDASFTYNLDENGEPILSQAKQSEPVVRFAKIRNERLFKHIRDNIHIEGVNTMDIYKNLMAAGFNSWDFENTQIPFIKVLVNKLYNIEDSIKKSEKQFDLNEFEEITNGKLIKLETVEDVERYKKYYRSDEVLCTFNNIENRLEKYDIWVFIKNDVNDTEPFDDPDPNDDYSTSVMMFQRKKEGNSGSDYIISRYNHSVDNPNFLFNAIFDNFYEGLSEYLGQDLKKVSDNLSNKYIIQNNKIYKYDIEIDGNIYHYSKTGILLNGNLVPLNPDYQKYYKNGMYIDTKEKNIIINAFEENTKSTLFHPNNKSLTINENGIFGDNGQMLTNSTFISNITSLDFELDAIFIPRELNKIEFPELETINAEFIIPSSVETLDISKVKTVNDSVSIFAKSVNFPKSWKDGTGKINGYLKVGNNYKLWLDTVTKSVVLRDKSELKLNTLGTGDVNDTILESIIYDYSTFIVNNALMNIRGTKFSKLFINNGQYVELEDSSVLKANTLKNLKTRNNTYAFVDKVKIVTSKEVGKIFANTYESSDITHNAILLSNNKFNNQGEIVEGPFKVVYNSDSAVLTNDDYDNLAELNTQIRQVNNFFDDNKDINEKPKIDKMQLISDAYKTVHRKHLMESPNFIDLNELPLIIQHIIKNPIIKGPTLGTKIAIFTDYYKQLGDAKQNTTELYPLIKYPIKRLELKEYESITAEEFIKPYKDKSYRVYEIRELKNKIHDFNRKKGFQNIKLVKRFDDKYVVIINNENTAEIRKALLKHIDRNKYDNLEMPWFYYIDLPVTQEFKIKHDNIFFNLGDELAPIYIMENGLDRTYYDEVRLDFEKKLKIPILKTKSLINPFDFIKKNNDREKQGYLDVDIRYKTGMPFYFLSDLVNYLNDKKDEFLNNYEGQLINGRPIVYYFKPTGPDFKIGELSAYDNGGTEVYINNDRIKMDTNGIVHSNERNNIIRIPDNNKIIINEKRRKTDDYYIESLIDKYKISNYLLLEEAELLKDKLEKIMKIDKQSYTITFDKNGNFVRLIFTINDDNILSNLNFSPSIINNLLVNNIVLEDMPNEYRKVLHSKVLNNELNDDFTCTI